jgi:GMP synthase-like glutamine amidotransferase
VSLSVLVLQHDPDDGPGYLGDALRRRDARLTIIRLDKGEAITYLSAYDMLLVMGGTMNVYQEEKYPWLAEETLTIQEAVEADKPVLGVCLGGQLLAKALGAPVRIGAAREVGLIPVTLTPQGKADPLFEGLEQVEAVEWHDDTFDIPSEAAALACSEGCANQAFRFRQRAYGLQFHPEVSPEMLTEWIKAEGDPAVDRSSFQRALETNVETLQRQADRLIANFIRATELRASP